MSLQGSIIAAMLAAALGSAGPARGADRPPPRCLPVAETRQLIADHGLGDPFALMQAASLSAHAEPIGAKLCRDDEALVYEISLLRHDGRVMRIYLDAATGRPHGGGRSRE